MSTYKLIYSPTIKDYRYCHLVKHLDLLLKQFGWVISENEADYVFIIDSAITAECGDSKVFHVIFSSDVPRYYCNIANNRDNFLIIRDIDTHITVPMRSCVQFITYPIPYSEIYTQTSLPVNNIFVSCKERTIQNSTLFKLVRPFNKLSHASVIFDSKDDSIFTCLNGNISVIDTEGSLSQYVASSDLVIGSGTAIVEAIIQKKRFVIVGENGYGGVPNSRNIFMFHENFFSGAIGGSIFDPIPDTLILEDIFYIVNNEINLNMNEIGLKLSHRSYNSFEEAISMFSQGANLFFNTDFTITAKDGRYILLNRYNRKRIMEIDCHTAQCISKDNISDIDVPIMFELKSKRILISK